ncbi:MAG: type II toxin-antitoxin system VapC family toxin [Desulfobacteraceae bacterium]|jgi:tRNA(fMet)-specific endonuclease VapC
MFVLDTNILSFFFKGMGNVAQNILSTMPQEIAIPAIVLFELELGIQKSTSPDKRRALLKQLTDLITIIPFGYDEAMMAASIRAKLEKNGTPIGPYDVLIAASALSGNHTLITHNTSEFRRIEGLKIQDWF